MATLPLLTCKLTPLLHAIAQVTLFEDAVNDHTWWTFMEVLPPPPPPAPLSTALNTRSLSEVKLCTELYGNEERSFASEDPNVMRLALLKNARWSSGAKLSVYFIGGSTLVRGKVRLSLISH
jgi:hypothetical protein